MCLPDYLNGDADIESTNICSLGEPSLEIWNGLEARGRSPMRDQAAYQLRDDAVSSELVV
jgi:hypothetical protein